VKTTLVTPKTWLDTSEAFSGEQTLREYLEDWFGLCESRGLRPGTIVSYRVSVELYVLPALGEVPVGEVRPQDLNRLYLHLLRRGRRDGTGGLAPRTVRYAHTIVRRAFADAVRLGYLDRNPADAADPPSARACRAAPRPTWTPAELARFLHSTRSSRLYSLFYLAAATGLRRGELLGLRWLDVDLERAELRVVQTVIEVGHEVRVGQPKSDRGRRVVALDEKTVGVLVAYRAERERRAGRQRGLQGSELLFSHRDGRPVRPTCVTNAFGEEVARAGVPRITLHDLRHTHATLALRAGVHPKVISERLGHSTIATTMDVYAHALPSLQREAAEAIGAFLPA
jgi:integrase